MFIAHLHQHLRLYTIRWMNLNVVVHPHVMHLIRDVQLKLLRQKSSILFWSTNENVRACWGYRHITWHSDFNFARTIGYGKVIGKMDKRDCVTISKQWTSSDESAPKKAKNFKIDLKMMVFHSFLECNSYIIHRV